MTLAEATVSCHMYIYVKRFLQMFDQRKFQGWS